MGVRETKVTLVTGSGNTCPFPARCFAFTIIAGVDMAGAGF